MVCGGAGLLTQSAAVGGEAGVSAALADPWFAGGREFLLAGGPVLWVLLGLSVAALSIVLVKAWQFATVRPEGGADVEGALEGWRKGQRNPWEGLDVAHPVAAVVALAMRECGARTDPVLLREEIDRVAVAHLNRLRALLPALEGIATLSPLLGLLGTVLGMIVAFQEMEAAGARVDPATLSSGIWQALLTTAMGLGVAIPALAVHNWMERKVERVAARMNDSVTRVFTTLAHREERGDGV